MVRTFQDLKQETTPPGERVWEDPDPRVKWALDILEPEGERETFFNRTVPLIAGAMAGLGTTFMHNSARRMPAHFNIFGYVTGLCIGIGGAEFFRRKFQQHRTEEMAMIKHYIMIHPEKFPEPELIKFGDKRMFWGWSPARWAL